MASIYSEEYQQVIKTLRQARIKQGISQLRLAEALGRPQSFVAKVENGERRLDFVELIHIARLLSVDELSLISMIMNVTVPIR
ncbi:MULTISPECIES: helix-turn-helix domain-containing protein [Yersinia]|uniref:helix-turn-helix domain-containing protein n=1 Tax=Yersinia TaxID=629 RepID=UPI0011A97297|nr:helix-turn-helix transcriptional regulator [Yersinia rochesterensis]EKN4115355.1 helix-turn-helix transcriptional regulator [Yersinia enterocolitica]EKN6243672.1 XRE family transcriptional regulator [Yersinia enterocolitica]HDL7859051.1 helix-turn-helix transcriptional regulator [Yersinia enterocolitica]HEI6795113.1 helix-turn-helix transcriptional regulator [Yersinia enterocolitica]HEN3586525.1 helix-turn-helix transcriptional regulator [Yersinia enterocolitica]